ncbi:tape measure protein [Chitinophaga sp. 22536]|uniref:tape measure protein n=1 Tax=unclassified Chitinophaga TaxID=2619133 RepID=UPI003F869D46
MSVGFGEMNEAAIAAFGKVSDWQRKVIANNGTMSMSIGEIQKKLEKIEALRSNSKSMASIVALDKVKTSLQGRIDSVNTFSSTINELNKATAAASAMASSSSLPGSADDTGDAGKKKKEKREYNFPIDKVISGATGLIKMGMDIEQTELAFTKLTGSAKDAKGMISDLQRMGASTPFRTNELIGNAQGLMESGVAAKNIIPTLTMLGNVSGGNKEKMAELVKTYGKITESGKLTADTVKELAAAGFNPLEQIAAKTGVKVKDLKDSLAAGKISAEQLTTVMAATASGNGAFANGMTAQSESATSRWGQFNDILQTVQTTIGSALLPIAADFIDNALIPIATWLQTAAVWLTQNADWFGFLGTAIGGLILGYKLWTMWQAALNLVMNLSPMGLMVGIGVALIGVVIYCWNTFEKFRGGLWGTWEAMKAFIGLIKDFLIDSLKGVASGLSGIGKALMHMFKGEWSQAWEVGKTAVADLTGVTAIKNAYNNGGKVKAAFNEGYGKGVNAPKIKLGNPFATPVMPEGFTGAGNTAAGAKLSGLEGAKNKTEGITGGGNKNIIINLQKLFDNINIHTTQLKEGANEVEQMVTEAFLRVLNSANAINI